MKDKKLIFIILGILLVLFVFLFAVGTYLQNRNEDEEEVHLHAGFIVVKNDEVLDFSDTVYMNITPCGALPEEFTEENFQLHKAHLHDNIGDVVHVHENDVYWHDLFENIGYKFENEPVAIVNGERVENILDYPIHPFDRVVFFDYANFDTLSIDIQSYMDKVPTKERILEVEGMSENCGT